MLGLPDTELRKQRSYGLLRFPQGYWHDGLQLSNGTPVQLVDWLLRILRLRQCYYQPPRGAADGALWAVCTQLHPVLSMPSQESWCKVHNEYRVRWRVRRGGEVCSAQAVCLVTTETWAVAAECAVRAAWRRRGSFRSSECICSCRSTYGQWFRRLVYAGASSCVHSRKSAHLGLQQSQDHSWLLHRRRCVLFESVCMCASFPVGIPPIHQSLLQVLDFFPALDMLKPDCVVSYSFYSVLHSSCTIMFCLMLVVVANSFVALPPITATQR
jgi:hypothetical protein